MNRPGSENSAGSSIPMDVVPLDVERYKLMISQVKHFSWVRMTKEEIFSRPSCLG